jgi:hypothetical protein
MHHDHIILGFMTRENESLDRREALGKVAMEYAFKPL